jgi:hypothetical protein
MVTIKSGERVSFAALADRDPAPDEKVRSSLRPGEVWEGTVDAIAWTVTGRQLVTVRVDLLNGMRTSAIKEVYADSVSWEPA